MLRDEIANRIPKPDYKIVVKLYVDIGGLPMTGNVPSTCDESRLRKFFIGFTQVQSTFDVVDTGHGLQEATVKLQGNVICLSC